MSAKRHRLTWSTAACVYTSQKLKLSFDSVTATIRTFQWWIYAFLLSWLGPNNGSNNRIEPNCCHSPLVTHSSSEYWNARRAFNKYLNLKYIYPNSLSNDFYSSFFSSLDHADVCMQYQLPWCDHMRQSFRRAHRNTLQSIFIFQLNSVREFRYKT